MTKIRSSRLRSDRGLAAHLRRCSVPSKAPAPPRARLAVLGRVTPPPECRLQKITLEDWPVLPKRRRRAAVVDAASLHLLPGARAGPSCAHLFQAAADSDAAVKSLAQ